MAEKLNNVDALKDMLIQTQQQLIEAQEKLLALQPNLPDEDVHWHKVSHGKIGDDVIESDDLALVQEFRQWIFDFGDKYLRPYVHPQVYAETISHMSRGIPAKLAELETLEDMKRLGAVISSPDDEAPTS